MLPYAVAHGGGDRSAGELDSPTDLVDGLRSFVKQHLEDGEVREAHLGRLDTAIREASERPERHHHHEPQVCALRRRRLSFASCSSATWLWRCAWRSTPPSSRYRGAVTSWREKVPSPCRRRTWRMRRVRARPWMLDSRKSPSGGSQPR